MKSGGREAIVHEPPQRGEIMTVQDMASLAPSTHNIYRFPTEKIKTEALYHLLLLRLQPSIRGKTVSQF